MQNSTTDLSALQSRMEFAQEIALHAGRHTLRYFQRADTRVELKSDQSPVTIADREAEQLLRQQIQTQFPQDGILGEEFGEVHGSSGYRWILDPIDGTKSFISGVPLYSTLVGLEHLGQAVLGVIEIPALNERVWGGPQLGAWYQQGTNSPVPARVSEQSKLAQSVLLTSDIKTFDGLGVTETYWGLQRKVRLSRTWGDGYGYLLVATGRAEVMIDAAMNPWDAAPLLPILHAAGGRFTDWNGEPTIYGGNGLASNAAVWEELQTVLAELRK